MKWSRGFAVILACAAAVLAGCGPVHATPAQIIFLRHAEKPNQGPELNERGRERAAALVNLFTHDPRVLEHGPAAAIFVMKPAKAGGSVRAIQTMEPAARALGVTPDTSLTRDELKALVKAINANRTLEGKTVVVCWEHDAIPKMLDAFGWTGGPGRWADKTFDRLWILDFKEGVPVRFRDLPQNLLPGDRAK